MFRSLKIGRWLGIDVFVHPTFWLLPLLVLFGSGAGRGPEYAVLELAVVFAAFGCVALHEYGHALAARWYGIRTRDITLYPIGGVARLEGMPEKPWPEIVVALAGPAVNVAIAAVLGGVLLVDGPSTGEVLSSGPSLEAFWVRLLEVNVGLVLFNLIPAFPMDGGRVLRALVSLVTDRVTATEVASVIGTGFAALFGAVGVGLLNVEPLNVPAQPMLAVLALALFVMGRGEASAVRYQDQQRRAERRHAARVAAWAGAPVVYPADRLPVARRVVSSRPDGWEFNPQTGVWTFYEGGVPVRRWRPE